MNLDIDIQERMNNVAFRYSHQLRLNIDKVLNKDKYTSSGYLANSVQVAVVPATASEPPIIRIKFAEYGEFIGKRKLLWTKYPPIAVLTKWVQREGYADGTSPVPGYKNGAPNLSPFKRATRIAYAIATKKRNENSVFRRQAWKRESLPSVLKDMNQATLEEFGSHIERILKDALENKN